MKRQESLDMATLTVVQEVLRGLTLSLAAASRADLSELSTALQGFADSAPGLEAISRTMLRNLAEGPAMLAAGRRQ
ncbi:hypothetical protein [Arenimonas caeni]|uniref:hypothetical protein n=1 Tax=Arenimonas caeni TaxID=2058085 RepID=UPI0013B062E2|nr:hypothetical protein [Arenimonas caeni]